MLLFRGVILPVGFILAGGVITARLALEAPHYRLLILPGLVLGFALIALGVHRIALVRRLHKGA